MLSKLRKLNAFLALLVVVMCGVVGMGNSWFYASGSVTLPNAANIVLDLDGNITSAYNGGSVSDGDLISSYVERSSAADTWSESGTNRPQYKANILNGKGVFRFNPANQTRLKSSTTTFFNTANPFTIYAVIYLTSFSQAYEYFFSGKAPSAAAAPSMAFSSNASFKDLFWGCDTTWMVWRATTISSPTASWKHIVIRYNGSGGTTLANFQAYNAGSSLTMTSTASNDGDGTYNIFGGYKTISNPYTWNGDIARFVIWNTDVGSGGVSQIAAYNLQEYAF